LEQKDILKDEIEKIGKVLAKILGSFFSLNTNTEMIASIESINTQLIDDLDIDIHEMLQMNVNELHNYIISKGLNDTHLDLLSNYIYEVGLLNKQNKNYALACFLLSKKMLQSISSISVTTSFSRIALINRIDQTLKSINGNQE